MIKKFRVDTINPQIQATQQTPSSRNIRKSTARQITTKYLKVVINRKLFWVSRGKTLPKEEETLKWQYKWVV